LKPKPDFHDVPWETVMKKILSPVGVTYEVNGKTVILKMR
jgi:hypothetical protein